jgi:hypothetical protein
MEWRCRNPRHHRGFAGVRESLICVTECVTHMVKHLRIGQFLGARTTIGYRVGLSNASDRAHSGQFSRICGRNSPAKYNRHGITDSGVFQDHRHRPLGHPSASQFRPKFAHLSRKETEPLRQCNRKCNDRDSTGRTGQSHDAVLHGRSWNGRTRKRYRCPISIASVGQSSR